MATQTRVRSLRTPVSQLKTLATANDLDGTVDGSQYLDVTGNGQRVIFIQDNSGTNGTAGIDVIEKSVDGGTTWAADTSLLPIDSHDAEGTFSTDGSLNAAGAEPTRYAIFKGGPYEGPTKVRCARVTTTTTGTTWVTGAPAVLAFVINGESGVPA